MAIPVEDPNEPSPPPGHRPPQDGPGPGLPSRESRNWGVAAHLAWLVNAFGIPAPIGPLVVWLVKKGEDPFVEDQAREALNFQLSVLIYTIIGAVAAIILAIVTFGLGLIAILPVVAVFALLVLVLTVVAAIKASDGERYRYPMTIRLIS